VVQGKREKKKDGESGVAKEKMLVKKSRGDRVEQQGGGHGVQKARPVGGGHLEN